MKFQALLAIIALGNCAACEPSAPTHDWDWTPSISTDISDSQLIALTLDLERIEEDLNLPGNAYALTIGGELVIKSEAGRTREGEPFNAQTALRFASVTKALTGIALIQLVEDGALSLDDPIVQWDESFEGPASTTVAEVAAHIAEGQPGTQYVYSSGRYARLQTVVEGASGMAFFDYLCDRILTPSGAQCLDSPALGAHAGLISTVEDMSLVFQALLTGRLVSKSGLDQLMTPTPLGGGETSPVSVGLFVSNVTGESVLWSFGQDDPEHSSVRVILWPDRQAAFVYLANSNAVSDAYRLLGGDIRADGVFHAVAGAVQGPDVINAQWGTHADWLMAIYNRDIDSVVSLYEGLEPDLSFAEHPALTYASSIMCLIDPAYGDFTLPIMAEAASNHPHDPWSLLFAAEGHEACGRDQEAAVYFRNLRDLTNQEDDLLRRLRLAWANGGLARLSLCSDSQAATAYVQAGLDTGVQGQTRDGLLEILQQINGEAPSPCS